MRYEHHYINLDNRQDRRAAAEAMFQHFEMPVRRVSASPDDDAIPGLDLSTFGPGTRGCFISHYRLLKTHLDECEHAEDFDHVLAIYEDDALFCHDFRARLDYLEKHLLEAQPWDMCFLGAFFHDDPPHWHPEGDHQQTSIKHIHRAYGVFTTHAYLVNPASISILLDKLREHAGHAIDTTYCKIQPEMNCYVVVPGMVAQTVNYSDIARSERDLTAYYKKAAGAYVFARTEADFDYDHYVFRQSTWKQHGEKEERSNHSSKQVAAILRRESQLTVKRVRRAPRLPYGGALSLGLQQDSMLRPQSLLIAVITCEACRDRADVVRRTWGRDAQDILYVIGRPGRPAELIGDTLYLDCPDTYRGLTKKVFALCRFIRDHLDFDRIYKCDDDTFVNVEAIKTARCPADLFGFVHSYVEPVSWRSHHGHYCEGRYRGPWVSGGLGYFLSRRAVSLLADFHDPAFFEVDIFEDKAVSDVLRMSGIMPAGLPGQRGSDLLQEAIDGWAFSAHPVGPGAMQAAYAKMLAPRAPRVLTYRSLGRFGRLGNQLWEIASTLGLAAYFRAMVSFNADWPSRDVFCVPDDCFVARQGEDAWKFPYRVPEKECIWMQDWWNWWSVAHRLREYFQPRPEFLRCLRGKYPEFFQIPESRRLAVHVRRGDYVGQECNYVPVSLAYYREAIARYSGMTPVVFSDDPGWCSVNMTGTLVAPVPARPEEHLVLSSLCKRHILANSTFGYWGAVLAGNNEVIYPSPWFGPNLSHIDLSWTMLPGWTPLPSIQHSKNGQPIYEAGTDCLGSREGRL